MLVGSGRRRGARVLGQVGLVVGVAGLLTDLCVGVTFWKAKPGRIAYLPSPGHARQPPKEVLLPHATPGAEARHWQEPQNWLCGVLGVLCQIM